jgi:hypothetical protein
MQAMTGPELQPRAVADDDRPWERPGAVRRDCAPHRGRLLLALATAAVVCGGLSILGAPALLTLPLAVAVWVLARRDLARMAAGRMDPAGQPLTAEARDRAVVAAIICVIYLAFFTAVLFLRSR